MTRDAGEGPTGEEGIGLLIHGMPSSRRTDKDMGARALLGMARTTEGVDGLFEETPRRRAVGIMTALATGPNLSAVT